MRAPLSVLSAWATNSLSPDSSSRFAPHSFLLWCAYGEAAFKLPQYSRAGCSSSSSTWHWQFGEREIEREHGGGGGRYVGTVMTLSTNAPSPAATDLSSSARLSSATASAGADERGHVSRRSWHQVEIEQLKAVAQPCSSKPPVVAAPGRRKRMRRSEREEAKKITQPCSECGKRFWSWKALFGHMRCHPNRSWRGIEPPPYVRRRTSPHLPADLPPRDDQPAEAELEAAYCLILLTGQQADGGTGHDLPPPSAIKVFKCSSCDKVFDSPHGLGGHRAGHARATRDVATRKRKAHASEQLHSCGFCSMSFPSGQALGGHVLIHCEEECRPERAASEPGAESSSTAGNGGCGFDLNLPAPEEMIQGEFFPPDFGIDDGSLL